jgi:hypothetical protein
MGRRFQIRWTHKISGREIISDYEFDGLGRQAGHSFGSWLYEICHYWDAFKVNGWSHNKFDLLNKQYPDMTEAELNEVR